jgi:hypothetical protein
MEADAAVIASQRVETSCSTFKSLWKIIILLYIIVMIPIGLIASGDHLPLFLTFWGWITLGVYFFISILGCLSFRIHRILPFLQALCFCLANLITLTVWTFHALVHQNWPSTPLWTSYNLSLHGLNLLFMYFDIFFFPERFRGWYIFPILFFGVVYAMVSGIYYGCTGFYEYPPLNWHDVKTLYWILAGGVALCVIFALGFTISKLGVKYWHRKW